MESRVCCLSDTQSCPDSGRTRIDCLVSGLLRQPPVGYTNPSPVKRYLDGSGTLEHSREGCGVWRIRWAGVVVGVGVGTGERIRVAESVRVFSC